MKKVLILSRYNVSTFRSKCFCAIIINFLQPKLWSSESVFEKDDQQSSCVHMFSEICDVQKLPGLKKRYIYVTEQGTGPTDSQASLWKQPIHHAWHDPLANQGQHWSTGKPPSWVGYLFDQRWFHRDVVVHTNYDKNCFHEYTLLSKSLVNKETVFFSKPRYELQHAALQVFLGQPAGHQPSLWLSFSPWPWP